MIEVVGWISQLCFMFSATPQAYLSYKQGHSDGVAPGMLTLWFVGESLSIVYGFAKDVPTPILVNYICNLSFMCVIIRYKLFRRS